MQLARKALTLAWSLLLGACASAPSHQHFASYDPDKDDFDANKYESVTQWAHTHGATVIWINYPTKYRPREIANQPANRSSNPSD